jgi:hypothetical protein
MNVYSFQFMPKLIMRKDPLETFDEASIIMELWIHFWEGDYLYLK